MVALYVRVSTEEQRKHGLSIDSQIEALLSYLKENNISDYKLYNDAGVSGHVTYKKRPALLELIDDCHKGQITCIYFTRLDRWFRSVKDYYLVENELNGIPWRAIWEDYETETSSGQLKVNIMLSVAEAEASRTSEKIKSVFNYKKLKGDYVGSAPTGYKIDNGALVKDPDKEDFIKAVFETYLDCVSITQTTKELRAKGYKTYRESVRGILENPAYYGECKNGYKCEPYISKETFDIIHDYKSKWSRNPTSSDVVYMFSGLIYCGECGRRMHAHQNKYGKDRSKICKHYICRASYDTQPSSNCISEAKVEAHLLANLEPLLGNLKYSVANSPSNENKADISRLEAKLERAKELYIDGDISREDYIAKKAAIEEEISALSNHSSSSAPIELPAEWRAIYDDLDVDHKKKFWKRIIKDIRYTKNNYLITFR